MRLKFLFALSLIPLASACVSVLPEPEAPEALYSIESDVEHAGLMHNVIIREPEAPRLVSGQSLISEGADGGLRVVPGVEWSGSATRQIQLAMVNSFKGGEPGNAVLPELGIVASYELASQLSVLRLQDQTGICEIDASLVSTIDRTLVAREQIRATERAGNDSPSARALALRAAAATCASRASAFVIDALNNLD
jgi:cholesterol transport system auxiliary component